MKHEYKKIYIIRNSDNIPLHAQEPMTLQQAVNRYKHEINELKKLGLYQSPYDFNIYDTERHEVVL